MRLACPLLLNADVICCCNGCMLGAVMLMGVDDGFCLLLLVACHWMLRVACWWLMIAVVGFVCV